MRAIAAKDGWETRDAREPENGERDAAICQAYEPRMMILRVLWDQMGGLSLNLCYVTRGQCHRSLLAFR
jgi:hypothetical protein